MALSPIRGNRHRGAFRLARIAMAYLLLACGISGIGVVGGLAPSTVFAQAPDPFEIPLDRLKKKDPENVVRFLMTAVQNLGMGDAASATVKLVTRDGFKIYDKGLEFSYLDAAGTTSALSVVANPAAIRIHDPNYDEPRDVHISGAAFSVKLPALARADGHIVVRFEACSVAMCLLPTRFSIPLLEGARGVPQKAKANALGDVGVDASAAAANQQSRVGAGEDPFADITGEGAKIPSVASSKTSPPALSGADSNVAPSTKNASLTDRASLWVQTSLANRSWTLFPGLFLAGLLMNLTPCVYPMIPITLNVLSRFGAGLQATDEERRRRRRLLPFLYVLGMVMAYSLVGVMAGMTGTLFGSLLQSQAVTLVLAAVMALLGLSMLDVFSLSAVQSLGNKIPVGEKHPVVGVMTMGAVSGLVSAPCTGPVLSAILLLIGQSKDPVYGFTLMLFYALGFGVPYIVLGLFTQKLGRLPKAGGVLTSVKYVFAALMFALSLYYLKPSLAPIEQLRWIFARPSVGAVLAGALFALVCILFGRLQPSAAKAARAGSVAALTALCLWFTLWITSGFVSLEPALADLSQSNSDRSGSATRAEAGGVRWMTDWDQALVRARTEKKPMVVDAWAEWCAACLKMDETVWKDSRVVELMNDRFVAVKLDFTRASPLTDRITAVWELSGLPAVGFFPVGAVLEAAPPTLFREAITSAKFLETSASLLPMDQGNAP